MYVIDLMFAVKLKKRTHLSYCTYIKYQIFLPCSQVTLQAHNGISFWFLHWIKSTPWISCDQGTSRRLTCWEQIDHGLQYTPTRMFLLIIPILLFFLTSFYTRCAYYHERTPNLHYSGLLLGVLAKTQFVKNAKTQIENTNALQVCFTNQEFVVHNL